MTNEFPFINVGGFALGGTLAFEQASEEHARLLINADMVEGDSSGGGGSGDTTPPTVKFTKPQYWKSGKRRKVCKVLKKNTRSKRKAFTKAKRSYCKIKKGEVQVVAESQALR